MPTQSCGNIDSRANCGHHVQHEWLSHEQRSEGAVADVLAHANVVILRPRVCLFEEGWNGLDPGLPWPLLGASIEESRFASIHDLLKIDAVDVDAWCHIPATKELIKIGEVGRQAKMTVNRCHL